MYRYARGAPSLRGPFCFPRPLRSPSMYGPLPVLPYPVLPCRGTRKRAPEAPTAQRANLGARRESLGKSRHPASRVASLHLASPRLASPRPVSPPPTDPTPSRHSSPCLASPRLASPRPPRLASPRLTSPRRTSLHLASLRLTSLRLACSRPRRASVSYIALAFVLIISNGAAARERNAHRSNVDARHYVPGCCASHVRALRA